MTGYLRFTNKRISDDTISILGSNIYFAEGVWILDLPSDINRNTYKELKRILKTVRGRWDGENHVFDYDPSDVIEEIVSKGCHLKNNPLQYFPTPSLIIEEMVGLISFTDLKGWKALEPSAGQGAIADVIRGMGSTVDCVELDPFNREILLAKDYPVIGEDFLELGDEITNSYDLVIMNPPFDRDKWVKHVLKAYGCLKPYGCLISICPTPPLINGIGNKYLDRKITNLIAEGGFVSRLGKGRFSDTNVGTSIIYIRRGDHDISSIDQLTMYVENDPILCDMVSDSNRIGEAIDRAIAQAREELIFLDSSPITRKKVTNYFLQEQIQ